MLQDRILDSNHFLSESLITLRFNVRNNLEIPEKLQNVIRVGNIDILRAETSENPSSAPPERLPNLTYILSWGIFREVISIEIDGSHELSFVIQKLKIEECMK